MLVEIYKLHAELTERAAALREEFTKIYTAAVSAIVAAGVLLHRLSGENKEPELEWVLPLLGVVVSLSWLMSFGSTTARLAAKHRTLLELEQELPFDFLTRESPHTPWRKHRRVTGSVMPVLFLLVCLAWLYAVVGE